VHSNSIAETTKPRAAGWLLVVFILAGIGAAIWVALPEAPASVKVGDAFKVFSLPDVQGKIHQPQRGDVMLLNFWATWCPPCRSEIPSMAALHDQYAGRGLKIVAVSVDRDLGSLDAFKQEYRMPFLVLHDAESTVSRQYGVFRYPESFLIDRDGNVVEHLIGAVEWMSAPITNTIETLLSTPATRASGSEHRGNGAEQG